MILSFKEFIDESLLGGIQKKVMNDEERLEDQGIVNDRYRLKWSRKIYDALIKNGIDYIDEPVLEQADNWFNYEDGKVNVADILFRPDAPEVECYCGYNGVSNKMKLEAIDYCEGVETDGEWYYDVLFEITDKDTDWFVMWYDKEQDKWSWDVSASGNVSKDDIDATLQKIIAVISETVNPQSKYRKWK